MTDVGAAADDAPGGRGLPVSRRGAVAILAVMLVAMFAIYWLLFRTVYVPLFERLPESDAAAVVAELVERKIPHRLAAGGTTILVPREQADRARLDIAASELPLRGQIGFELFNDSDMGLTEFAQKINYQRALQGELARTIMLLDGVENARVHLALPERALFRGSRNAPSAAVTLIARAGQPVAADRILGIQRLVAGAVPDLSPNAVSVLDETGRVVSESTTPGETGVGVSSESAALANYYRARILAAAARVAPDLAVGVTVRAAGRTPAMLADASADDPAAAIPTTPAEPGVARDVALEVQVTTEAPLDAALRDQIVREIMIAARLDRNLGDRLFLAVGPVTPPAAIRDESPPVTAPRSAPDWRPAAASDAVSSWPWLIAGVLALGAVAVALWSRRRRDAAGSAGAVASFADQLRARLTLIEARVHADR